MSPDANDSPNRRVRQIAGISILLALVCWFTRDFLPSFAADQVSANAEVTTIGETNDDRVRRAFEKAIRSTHIKSRDVDIATEPPSNDTIRDSTITIRAANEAEVLDGLHAITESMRLAYEGEGGGEFQVNERRLVTPVENDRMRRYGFLLRCVSFLLALVGIAGLTVLWQRKEIDKRIFLIAIPLGIPFVLSFIGDLGEWAAIGLIVMPIPIVITVLVVKKSIEVKRARSWNSATAEILKSSVKVERHRFGDDEMTVKNKAAVTYEFEVNGERIVGDRIGIGEIAESDVDATVKKYAVGSKVTVYYDAAEPKNCVLERDPPASIGCMFIGAGSLLALGAVVVAFFTYGSDIDSAIRDRFPNVHHPLMALMLVGMSAFTLVFYVAGRKRAKQIATWPTTKGRIVTSRTEEFRESMRSSNTGRSSKMYRTFVEYRYEVDGREYHSTQLAIGAKLSSSSKALADAVTAKYKEGSTIDVRYDPNDVSQAVVQTGFAGGVILLVIAAGLLALAYFVATHG